MRARILRTVYATTVIGVMAASFFLAGFALGRTRSPQVDEYLATALSSVGLSQYAAVLLPPTPAPPQPASPSPEQQERFKVFWEAWSWVEKEFYDRSALDPQKMTYAAIRGALSTLGDPHTVFLDPVAQRISESEFRGAFEGIGVHVDLKDGQLQVVAPVDGSPGARAGLKTGDVITHVDGRDISGMALMDSVMLIRGPKGTSVSLTVRRPGLGELLSLTIVREEIKIPSVRWEMRPDGLAYLRITRFLEPTHNDTVAALRELLRQNPRGLILDLRNNPGGYLHTSVDVASQFLADGVVVYQQQAGGQRQTYAVKPGGLATRLPLAVLVNKGSASASEIVAAALQAHGRGPLVGERTYGKGTVQNIHQLSDNSSVRVTFARWLSPNEVPLEGKGLQPDIEVPAATQGGEDRQLEAAARYLSERG